MSSKSQKQFENMNMTIYNLVYDTRDNNDDILLYLDTNRALLKNEIDPFVPHCCCRRALLLALAMENEKSESVLLKLIEVGGRGLVTEKDYENGRTALHYACCNEAPVEVVSKLIEVGGREFVMEKDDYNDRTALHYACYNEAPVEVISKLIEVGGRELVMEKDYDDGRTALHYTRCNKSSVEVISKLIEVGGRELVMDKDDYGRTALHYACCTEVSVEVISKLIEVGGRELVMEKDDEDGLTALHYACFKEASVEVISKLIEVGGRELVTEKDDYKETALHDACRRHASVEVVSKVIEVGGSDLLRLENRNRDIPLHCYFHLRNISFGDSLTFVMKECISAQIGGEFGVGGLFNTANNGVQDQIYDKWEQLAPSLETIVADLLPLPPILQAAIIAKAPKSIITDIINRFKLVPIIEDSFNRYPIDVAVEQGLRWNEGMQQVIESNAEVIVDRFDQHTTGLHLFMHAAMDNICDLSTVYQMRRMNP